MSKEFAPMLAATAPKQLTELPWEAHAGYLVTPKLDGIRAIVRDGVLLSRKLLPIPNPDVQRLFGRAMFNGLDGELIVGDPWDKDCYRRTMSLVMSHSTSKNENVANVYFYVFDMFTNTDRTHAWRAAAAARFMSRNQYIVSVPYRYINDEKQLLTHEESVLLQGYEGLMLRAAGTGQQGLVGYKHGRSTVNEGYLIKLKRFEDAEAVVLGVEEEMRNDNAASKDALGRSKRSSAKSGLVGKGRLGALRVRDVTSGAEFNIGSGFTAAERVRFWEWKGTLAGRTVKYKYFASGSKDAPRFPVFLGFRSEEDM